MVDTTVSLEDAAANNSLVGWVPEDGGRGTWKIITSSLFTVIICTWTAIHPRIHVTRRLRNVHKFYQLVKIIFAPEMVCLESLQEWVQARKSVRRCAEATNGQFKIVHGYYLGMMGVRYRTGEDGGYRTLWPGQYAWLLNNGLVSWDDHREWGLSEEDIEDKSKADGLVKLAALLQVIWFTLQCVTRAAHDLPLAPLEAMTLAYVFNALITYGFWWSKPKDIATASFVDLPEMTTRQRQTFEGLTMEETYDVSDPGQKQNLDIAWYVVARDCRDDEVLVMSQVSEDVESKADSVSDKGVVVSVEDSKVITEWDANLYMTRYWPLICLLGASFGAIHLISWDTTFPTTMELWLWRVSALVSVATSVLCMQFRSVSLHWEGPLTIVKVGSPVLYIVSRVIMAGETFAGLRAMEARTYFTFDMWNYWFHLF